VFVGTGLSPRSARGLPFVEFLMDVIAIATGLLDGDCTLRADGRDYAVMWRPANVCVIFISLTFSRQKLENSQRFENRAKDKRSASGAPDSLTSDQRAL
jgi:hypothetical protein